MTNYYIIIGATVHSTTHPAKGPGLVVGLKAIFGWDYVDVFFEKTKEKLTIPAEELVVCRSPEEKLQQGLFSDAGRFMLRLMLEQIRELNSLKDILSVTENNFISVLIK